MQFPLTTFLQLVVCVCKQVTKQPFLTSLQATKIANIFLKDTNPYRGPRGCTYFEGRVHLAFLTPIPTKAIYTCTYKMIPTSHCSKENGTNDLSVYCLSVTQKGKFRCGNILTYITVIYNILPLHQLEVVKILS